MLREKTKGILIGTVIGAMLGSGAMAATTGTLQNVITSGVTIFVNGKQFSPTDANGQPVEPFIYEGTTYLPVRAVSNALNVDVDWDQASFSVYLDQPDGTAAETMEGSGYATPEQAAVAYLTALKRGDPDGMLAACAVETYADSFDLAAQIERLQVYTPYNALLPDNDAMSRTLNANLRQAELAYIMRLQYQFLSANDSALTDGAPIRLGDGESGQALLDRLYHSGLLPFLNTMVIGDAIDPTVLHTKYEDPNNQANLARQAAILGAQELRSVAIPVLFGSEALVFCPDVAQYNGRWYIANLQGNLANLLGSPSTQGGLVKNAK